MFQLASSRRRGFLILGIAFACTSYAIWSGLIREVPARFLDTRWFYAAGICLNRGELPYSLPDFENCWLANFTRDQFAPFLFSPVSWPIASFLALFSWPTAKWIFAGANCLCVFVVVVGLGRVIDKWNSSNVAFIWLLFAGLAGSMSGNVAIGQGALISTLGMVLTLNGVVLGSATLLVIGALLASIKPHIVAIPMIFLFFFRPESMLRAKIIAMLSFWLLGFFLYHCTVQAPSDNFYFPFGPIFKIRPQVLLLCRILTDWPHG